MKTQELVQKRMFSQEKKQNDKNDHSCDNCGEPLHSTRKRGRFRIQILKNSGSANDEKFKDNLKTIQRLEKSQLEWDDKYDEFVEQNTFDVPLTLQHSIYLSGQHLFYRLADFLWFRKMSRGLMHPFWEKYFTYEEFVVGSVDALQFVCCVLIE